MGPMNLECSTVGHLLDMLSKNTTNSITGHVFILWYSYEVTVNSVILLQDKIWTPHLPPCLPNLDEGNTKLQNVIQK